jgi:hypothetical protein
MLGPGEIFTQHFVTLGPLKILGPFAQQTNDWHLRRCRALSFRGRSPWPWAACSVARLR